MIYSSDREHTDHIETKAYTNGYPANPEPERHNAGDVNAPESSLLNQVNPLKVIFYGSVAVVHNMPFTKSVRPDGAMTTILEQGDGRIRQS
jgi:hypothetical protein